MKKQKTAWFCPVCNKKMFLLPCHIKLRKTCSYSCNNKSDFHRQRVSEGLKNNIPWNKGINGYTTTRKGMHHSDETKLKMSENSWTRKPGFYEKYYRTKVSSPSKYELFFSNLLKQRNINYIAQAVINNKFQVDFLIGNLIIEIDGEWHYQRGKLRFEDVVRDCQIRNWGYDIIHIKNKEVGLFES